MTILHHALDGSVISIDAGFFGGCHHGHSAQVVLIELSDFFCGRLVNYRFAILDPISKRCMPHLFTNPFTERQPTFHDKTDFLSGVHINVVNKSCKQNIVKGCQHMFLFCKVQQAFCFPNP